MWSKKGQSVYWFSVFTPGSASLSREVTALATVVTQAETDTHTQSGKGWGSKVIYTSTSSPSDTQTKMLKSLVNSEWCLEPRHGRHRFTLILHQTSCIITPFLRLNPSSRLSWPLNRINSQSRFTQTQLIQGKLCICRQYGQFKGDDVNIHHRKRNFQAWHLCNNRRLC